MAKKSFIILIVLLVIHLGLLALFAGFRVLDGDEGFYLNATRMVGLGMALYTDFFYTQLSLMPTVFAPLALDGWNSFWILRGMAAAAGFLSAVVLFSIVMKMTRDTKVSLIALGMYCLSGIILSWHSAYKPLPFSHLLTLATFFFWLLYNERKRLPWLIIGGLCLSALINLRAVFIVLLPLYLFSVWYISDRHRVRNIGIFCLSLIPFAVPTLLHIIKDADRFFFDTFIFQLHRADSDAISYILTNKLLTVFKTIIDPHLLIIFGLAAISLVMLFRGKKLIGIKDFIAKPEGMAFSNLALIAFVYFIPNPILRQYVEQFMAFALILAVLNLSPLLERLKTELKRYQRVALLSTLIFLYLVSLAPYVGVYLFGMRKSDTMYRLSEVRKITSKMLEMGTESDTVLAEWTGYPFFTKQVSLPYTELLGFEYPLPISHEEYMKYKLADYIYLRDEVEKKSAGLVVTVKRVPPAYADILPAGYDSLYESGQVAIHVRQ